MSLPAGPRQARLTVTRIDPWSVAKAAFLLALVLGLVICVAIAVLWLSLDSLGVFAALSRTVDEIIGNAESSFDLMSVLSFGRVMGVALVVASVEIVLMSVFAAIFAFLYNLTVAWTGGVEVVVGDAD